MPELPEVETLRASASRELVGKKITTCAVTNGRVLPRYKKAKDFYALVEGRTVKTVARLGHYLLIMLDNQSTLVVTLGPTGQLMKAKNAKESKPKYTHVVMTLNTKEELRFADHLFGGELYVSTPLPEGEELLLSKFARLAVGGDGAALRKAVPELALVGIDPLEDQLGWDRFAAVVRSRSVGLRTMLTDQSIICGLGDIYADEILYAAGLMYDRACATLSTIEIRRLHRTIPEILHEAIKNGGTTLVGESFVNLDGQPGHYQDFLQVYGRGGAACFQCRTPVTRLVYERRPTYFCAKCQS